MHPCAHPSRSETPEDDKAPHRRTWSTRLPVAVSVGILLLVIGTNLPHAFRGPPSCYQAVRALAKHDTEGVNRLWGHSAGVDGAGSGRGFFLIPSRPMPVRAQRSDPLPPGTQTDSSAVSASPHVKRTSDQDTDRVKSHRADHGGGHDALRQPPLGNPRGRFFTVLLLLIGAKRH